jgi:predicted PilT family ATPase
LPENDLTFRELLKKLLLATEQYGISIADEPYSDRVEYMDVKKYVDKIIAKYETLKKERDELKEKYCDYINEDLK